MNTLFNFFLIGDAPRAWGFYFQDSASPQMEALVELHDNIMFYLVIVLFLIGWILVSIIRNYVSSRSPISNKYLNHGTLIELIWTITPALILILIAFPSFKLLYLMDEVSDPSLTVFVEGHQWYWSYQYPDFLNEDFQELEFYSESWKYNLHSNHYDPDVPIDSIEGGSGSESPEDVSSCSCGCGQDHAWEREPEMEQDSICCDCDEDIPKGTGGYINDTCSCTMCNDCI